MAILSRFRVKKTHLLKKAKTRMPDSKIKPMKKASAVAGAKKRSGTTRTRAKIKSKRVATTARKRKPSSLAMFELLQKSNLRTQRLNLSRKEKMVLPRTCRFRPQLTLRRNKRPLKRPIKITGLGP